MTIDEQPQTKTSIFASHSHDDDKALAVSTMVATFLLFFGALVSSTLAFPLLPDTSALALQLSNISTLDIGLLNTSTRITNLHATFKAKCFAQKTPPEPLWIPPLFDDCANIMVPLHAALGKVHPSGDFSAPMVFSKDTSSGLELPRTFKHGSCAILIDISSSKNFELMPPQALLDAVWTLATRCVSQPGPRVGGNGVLGPKQLIGITVYGIRERKLGYLSDGSGTAMYQDGILVV